MGGKAVQQPSHCHCHHAAAAAAAAAAADVLTGTCAHADATLTRQSGTYAYKPLTNITPVCTVMLLVLAHVTQLNRREHSIVEQMLTSL